LGELAFGANTYSAAQLTAADPRHIGLNSTLSAAYYKSQLPQASVGDNGSTSAYVGTFDQSCGALSGSICDSVNVIGYKANILTPQSSNFLATRMDHDFGPKWHLIASYRYYSFTNLPPTRSTLAVCLREIPLAFRRPWRRVRSSRGISSSGLMTTISSSLTNDFHYSYPRNFWQWKGGKRPPQVAGALGAIELLGESSTIVLFSI
jgi:hypothetical protein